MTRMHRSIPTVACILCMLPWMAYAQAADTASSTQRFGVYGQGALFMHAASFASLPNVPACCPEYAGPTSLGGEAGALAMFRLSPRLQAGLRLGVQHMIADFRAVESTTVLTPEPTEGRFVHTLNTTMTTLRLMPTVDVQITSGLHAMAGLSMGWVIASSYEQQESIDAPLGAVFTDTRTQVRNVFSGTIDGATAIQASLRLGAAYDLPLTRSGSMSMSPELWYEFNLADYVQDRSWTSTMFRFGLSFNVDLSITGSTTVAK